MKAAIALLTRGLAIHESNVKQYEQFVPNEHDQIEREKQAAKEIRQALKILSDRDQ